MDYKEHHRLNQEFLERFPLEKLKDMTIEQYTNLNRSDSFCYWLEIKTRILGSISGNSSFKFGIYQYNTRPNDDRARMSDGKYAWNSSYGKTARKAFENVKKAVVKAAESGYAGDLDAIESIELAPMIKWKIAFMYSNESIIPYYSLDRLRVIGERMGMGNTQDASIADIQKFLIKERKGRDIHEYGRLLDDIWKESDSTTERTESSDKEDKTMQTTNIDKYIQLLQTNKNLILTGAPGTGKTYLAKQIAKQIMNVKSDEELQNNKCYGFVQFHPSYDYTDFVEGLRPTKENQSGDIGFKRQDGVFKAFCKQAILSETADADTLSDINDNPTVWKVSLGGTYDNPTRTDCLNNGYIRIGWPGYGDIEDFNDYEDFKYGGKVVLRAFQSGMQIGDLVVSCYSAKEIDAIGVVTGEYEYHAEGAEYPRYRNVKWLVKGIKENILEINNNKTFTLSTVYKASITAEAALKIVQKYSKGNMVAPRKEAAVFVIDEINRGEISKIFGELFFSIDPGYRGVAGRVKTQYQNLIDEGDAFKDGFYVPENVYIIGTMNDIDRSVESMDFAMRRRFAWAEVTAEESMQMLNGTPYENEAKKRMQNLNEAILKVRGLGEAYQIGAAYFKKIEQYNGDFQKLWNFHLKGLLFEYLRGNLNAEEQLKELKEAYDNKE